MDVAAAAVRVSVVIVNWNTRDLVLRLLADLSRSTAGIELELIVVDNHSSDGSIESIRSAFPNVLTIAQDDNRGFAGGVNPGVAVASAPFVMLLNSDTRTTPEAIEAIARYMANRPEVGIAGPRVVGPDGCPQESCWRDPSLLWTAMEVTGLSRLSMLDFARYAYRHWTHAHAVDCVSGCALMVRRELFQRLGGLDEAYFMYFEETDLCLRMRREGPEVHYVPHVEVVHERGGTAKTVRLRTFLDFRRSQILYHRKHHGALAAAATRALLFVGSMVRVPPLALRSIGRDERSSHARARLHLHIRGLKWLSSLEGGLVPTVDRPHSGHCTSPATD